MRMCDTHRVKGWWSLPAVPDKRVPGILTWSQEEGAQLELIGGLSHGPDNQGLSHGVSQSDRSVFATTPTTIYGETDAGTLVALWGAERTNYIADFRQIREEFWHSAWVCVGAHITSASTPALRDLVVALDDLYYLTDDGRFCPPRWAEIDGVEHPGEEQPDGTLLMPFILPVVGGLRVNVATGSTPAARYSVDTYATRPFVSPATEAMPELKLQFMTEPTRSGRSINLSVGARARITFSDSEARAAEDLLHGVSPLLGLMCLATFADSGVEWMRAKTMDGTEVSLLCHLGHPSSPDLKTSSGSVVFTFTDVTLGDFLKTWEWLSTGHQAQYAWSVVVGLIGHSPRMVEEHVSQVLAAAEGFHRWCLRGGKGKELRERLILLHDRLPQELKAHLALDVGKWAGWAVWARNHVAHGGAERHRDVGDFYRLKVIADSVRLVTYLAALQELKVPVGQVKDALLNHSRIHVLAERCAEIAELPDL